MFGSLPRSRMNGLAYRTAYARRKSGYAKLCGWSGLLSFIVLIISLGAFYFGRLEPVQFFWAIGGSFILAFLVLCFAIPAMRDFFVFDALGAGTVARAIFLSSFVLIPLIWLGYKAAKFPKINDIATSDKVLPQFEKLADLRQGFAFEGGNFSQDSFEAQKRAYPVLGPHRYSTNAQRVGESVIKLARKKRWQEVSIPSSLVEDLAKRENEVSEDEDKSKAVEKEKLVRVPLFADEALAKIQGEEVDQAADLVLKFEMIVPNLLPRLGSDVVIQLDEINGDTIVNMRAANRHLAHDYGANADLIAKFLDELDNELLGVAGETSAAEEE